MERNPLWIGEVDIVRAIFGHAAHANPSRLQRIAPPGTSGHATQVSLEERIPRRRLDALVRFSHGDGRTDQYLIVEAKVGAVVAPGTLTEYLDKVGATFGQASGLLVAAYKPVGGLPPGWDYLDLEEAANLLSCHDDCDGLFTCQVCEEIHYAVASSTASKTVTEWRVLAQATASASIPDGWITKGNGSSVGRPLVYFQSQWLDDNENCYVQVEVGNNYGLPAASVMIVATAPTAAAKVVFPDRLWQVLIEAAQAAPALPDGIIDASTSGRGARGQTGADARRLGVPATWSRGFSMRGWHGRGRALRFSDGDYATLLTAALEQGISLSGTARHALRIGPTGF